MGSPRASFVSIYILAAVGATRSGQRILRITHNKLETSIWAK